MSKKPDPELVDDENPEWTDADFKRALPFEAMPQEFKDAVRRGRGPNKAPTKRQVTLRLSPDVLDSFESGGPGWQTRIDNALRDWLKTHRAA
jgi:uncharacterized protein (DUF4415 family)